MMFKRILLTVACILIVSPVESRIISNLRTAAVGTVSDIASIVPNVIRAKGSAVLQAAAQAANIASVGAGFKVQALERLSSSITGSISEGLVSMGRVLSRQGTGLAEERLKNFNLAGIGMIPEDNMSGETRRAGRRQLNKKPHSRIVHKSREHREPHETTRTE